MHHWPMETKEMIINNKSTLQPGTCIVASLSLLMLVYIFDCHNVSLLFDISLLPFPCSYFTIRVSGKFSSYSIFLFKIFDFLRYSKFSRAFYLEVINS